MTVAMATQTALVHWLIAGDEAVAGPLGTSSTRADLVTRARSGDQEAFEVLIRAAGDHLLAVARKILRDPDAAEDALQQAVIQAWRRLPQLRDPDRFDAWLYRILVMACYAEANRARRFAGHVRSLSPTEVEADFAGHLADREALEQAFTSLTPAHRAVVVLHHFAGLPTIEVAQALGVSHGTVRSRLHYALRTLRSALEAMDREDAEARR
jgi:RNA polymerase sigma-70 factor (ECF subfamily)